MKKVIIVIFISLFSFASYAQFTDKEIRLSLGVNTVNSLGKWSPFNSPDDWAFKNPISLGIEYKWLDHWSVEQSFSINTFTPKSIIDSGNLNRDLSFFSTNTKIKFYFDDFIFYRKAEWLEFNVNAGIGVFTIDGDLNASINLGGDIFFWINDKFGISLKSLGKFALNSDDTIYLSNHFQHHLQVVYKFGI
jgi:hypothetical protein